MTATQPPRVGLPVDRTAPVPDHVDEACVNCGRVLLGPHCTACGERRASDRDNSFWGFTKEAFQTVTNADRSFLGTLKTLIARPGQLTAEYMRGRRAGLMRPLQLFLLVNVVFFLWASFTGSQIFSTNLRNHMNNTWHSGMATRMVNQRLGDGTVTAEVYGRRLEEYRKQFDKVAAVQAKSLIFVMVPAFAVLVGLLHARRRRYVVEHMVFALHIYSAFLVSVVVITIGLGIPLTAIQLMVDRNLLDNPVMDGVFGAASGILLVWYFRRALMTVYGDGKWAALGLALILFVGIALNLFAYRTLLFLTTFWAT